MDSSGGSAHAQLTLHWYLDLEDYERAKAVFGPVEEHRYEYEDGSLDFVSFRARLGGVPLIAYGRPKDDPLSASPALTLSAHDRS